MKLKLTIYVFLFFLTFTSNASENKFEDAVDNWESYKDVGQWLNENFKFDKQRQKLIHSRLKAQGPTGLLIRDPQKTFLNSSGYCADAAHFAKEVINNIDPEYNAQWLFITNESKGPNHWVTGFYDGDELYVMDYGTGQKWNEMKGIHGPYKSLKEYKNYLASLSLEAFEVGNVFWRDMPGQVD